MLPMVSEIPDVRGAGRRKMVAFLVNEFVIIKNIYVGLCRD
jgi:hypothetical protein